MISRKKLNIFVKNVREKCASYHSVIYKPDSFHSDFRNSASGTVAGMVCKVELVQEQEWVRNAKKSRIGTIMELDKV